MSIKRVIKKHGIGGIIKEKERKKKSKEMHDAMNKRARARAKKKKKPVEGMLEKQGYMDLYEGPAKKAKKKRRFTKVDEEV